MFNRMHALYAPEGDGTDGAGAGGSPDGGQGDDKELIPVSRLKAAIADQGRRHSEELGALKAEIQALKEARKPVVDAPKVYTRAELNAAVEAGQITKEQADAHMDAQTRAEAKAEARQEALHVVSAAERKRNVDDQINRYKAVAPEILDESHETRQRIKAEFQALVDLGDDKTAVATQLKAIRAVLGPIENLERARGGRSGHETHQETGGGGGGQGPKKSFKDTLNEAQRKHYEKGISSGLYKDWDAVKDELAFARKRA